MLGKLVGMVVSPLGTSLLLGGVAMVLVFFVRSSFWRRVGAVAGGGALVWLWFWSMPMMSDALRGRIEAMAGPRSIEKVSASGVVVVLGGGVDGPRIPFRYYPDLGSASDRVWHAARLYRAGKCRQIVLSGGVMPGGDGSEAVAMQCFLLDLGVPKQAIVLEEASENTIGNARLTRERLKTEGVDRIILVTSALHMPRARRIFERAGFEVIAAPADFEVVDRPFDFLCVFPDAKALNGSSRAMKELVGLLLIR
ncbi:YdcF family protein [Chlorobium phaeovibrioides]|nr:YdcF family protein [Chlorobium phaeovibrioides]